MQFRVRPGQVTDAIFLCAQYQWTWTCGSLKRDKEKKPRNSKWYSCLYHKKIEGPQIAIVTIHLSGDLFWTSDLAIIATLQEKQKHFYSLVLVDLHCVVHPWLCYEFSLNYLLRFWTGFDTIQWCLDLMESDLLS